MKLNAVLNTDQEGFVSQECPECRKRFKVKFSDNSAGPIAFCPYCRHSERDCWWTPEQAEYMEALLADEASSSFLAGIGEAQDEQRRGSSGISIVSTPGPTPKAPAEREEEMLLRTSWCCGEAIKVHSPGAVACVICGADVPLTGGHHAQ